MFETTINSSTESNERQGSGDRVARADQAPYLTPYSAAEIVDPHMWNVTCAKWTSVIKDDQLLRQLLNSYFLHQYSPFFAFQKDYFLQDMARGGSRFCSPLLVNTILAAACRAHSSIPDRAKFWDPDNLAYRFLAEAKRLWELQVGRSSLTSIQAAILLNTISNSDGMDKIGRMYMLQAVAMANDIGLFGSHAEIKGNKMRRARAFTAWGVMAWDAMESFYFHREPLLKRPPDGSPPDPAVDPAWYGEIWVRYPLNSFVSPTHLGSNTKALMDLRLLMHDMAHAYFGRSVSQERGPALAQVLGFRSRLDAWFSAFPAPLRYRQIMLPSHIKVHMEYYTTVITLAQSQSQHAEDHAASYGGMSPSETISDAYIRLETLMRLYYLRHSFDAHDMFLIQFLVFLGNQVLEILDRNLAPQDVDAYRSTLILCVMGLHIQGASSYLMHVIYYLLRNRMKPHDRDLLLTYVKEDPGEDEELIAQHTQANWVLPIIKINEDPKTAILDNLVKEYETLSMDGASTSSPNPSPSPSVALEGAC
ncbi:Zn(2)-C6 fungal-type DNA-binding domain [Fusarium albosuccineum]|uniref:Zn(2)-C6 fungal-type DNA-binding domain n=1 Tax=Fusarium albosuccineum TaxID=1237068 RepID=A0A8H4LIG5_9HYPO|nr:Zn(2)-C6 fungal-type DNA-binding domain [Fusarium albosuccineum]